MYDQQSTNQLITVAEREIGGELIQTINARDLHAFLEVKSEFRNWIKNRIEDFSFTENEDFTTAVENYRGGDRRDYFISLDMAKELSMVERNAKGRQARQYFLECERRAKSAVAGVNLALMDPAALRSAILAFNDRVASLEATVQQQAPKVQFHDAVTEATNCQSIQEVAKILDVGPNRFFKVLRDEGLLMRNNLPYQEHIDAGRFRVIEGQYTDNRGESHTYSRTLVTGRGFAFIQKRIHSRILAGPASIKQGTGVSDYRM